MDAAVNQPQCLRRDGGQADVDGLGTPEADYRTAGTDHGQQAGEPFPCQQTVDHRQGHDQVMFRIQFMVSFRVYSQV